MTIDFALTYIPRRMEELGYANNYFLKPKHLILQPGEQRKIEAHNQYFILIQEAEEVKIASEFGFYDLLSTASNELDYEHQGMIIIDNYSQEVKHLKLIQVIPKHKTLCQ